MTLLASFFLPSFCISLYTCSYTCTCTCIHVCLKYMYNVRIQILFVANFICCFVYNYHNYYNMIITCTCTFTCIFIFSKKSASFGKGFLGPDVPPDVVNEFVEMCHHLRVLNSVRVAEMGLPITLRQYPLSSQTDSSLL